MKLVAMNEMIALYSCDGAEYPFDAERALEDLLGMRSWKNMITFAKGHARNTAFLEGISLPHDDLLLNQHEDIYGGMSHHDLGMEWFLNLFDASCDTSGQAAIDQRLSMNLFSLIERESRSDNTECIEYLDKDYIARHLEMLRNDGYCYLNIDALLEYKREMQQLLYLAAVALGAPIPEWMYKAGICGETDAVENDDDCYYRNLPFAKDGFFGDGESAFSSSTAFSAAFWPNELILAEQRALSKGDTEAYARNLSAEYVIYCLEIGPDIDYNILRESNAHEPTDRCVRYGFSLDRGFNSRNQEMSIAPNAPEDMFEIVKAAILENRVALCPECGRPFITIRKSKKHCSKSCKNIACAERREKVHLLSANHTIKEVLELFPDDNPETVRRWYEDGKKLGAQASGKTDGR